MALLDSSSASRHGSSGRGSAIDRMLFARMAPQASAGKPRDNSKTDEVLRRTLQDQRNDTRSKDIRDQRENQVESLRRHKNERTVIGLLEKIAQTLEQKDRGKGLGNLIAGGALAELLMHSGLGGGSKKIGFKRDANGRWRNAQGRFTEAPPKNFIGRQLEKVGNTRVGRAVGRGMEKFGESRAGRLLGGAGRVMGRNAGRLARSPLGRIGGSALRLGGNFIGRAALPIAAGMAVVDGINGMRHSDDIMGRKTSLNEKVGVGVAEAVNGALMGIPDLVANTVFGKSFSKLMVDGVEGIKDNLTKSVTDTIDNIKDFIGNGIGKVGNIIGGAFASLGDYVKNVEQAGGDLVTAVKGGDFIGAAKALGNLGKLLFKATPLGMAVTAAKAVAPAVIDGAKQVGSFVADKAGKAAAGIGSLVSSGVGAVSSMFESGRSGAGTVSSGKGDHGGVSYGKFQLATNNGAVGRYVAQSKYSKEFAGLSPGTDAFNAKWKEVAAKDPKGFEDDQQQFIAKTNYSPQMAKLAKAGIDLSNRGRAVQEAVFSTSVQYGGSTNVIQKALAGKDVSKMSDTDIVSAIQDYKAATVETKFKSSSAGVKKGVLARIAKEKAVLTGMAADPKAAGVKVAATMADAKSTAKASADGGAVTTASSAVSDTPPLTETLPTPGSDTDNTPAQPTPAATDSKSSADKSGGSNSSGGRSTGAGGLPSVNDVADRPRIDLQAIATTLSHR